MSNEKTLFSVGDLVVQRKSPNYFYRTKPRIGIIIEIEPSWSDKDPIYHIRWNNHSEPSEHFYFHSSVEEAVGNNDWEVYRV